MKEERYLESTLALGIESFKAIGEQTKRAYDVILSNTNYLTKSIDDYRNQDLKTRERDNKRQDALAQDNKFLNEKLFSESTANSLNIQKLGNCKNDLVTVANRYQNLENYYFDNVANTEGNALHQPKIEGNALNAIDPAIIKRLDDLYTPSLPKEVVPKKK